MTALRWLVGGGLGAEGHLAWTAPSWVVVAAAVLALVGLAAAWRGPRAWPLRLAETAAWALALAGVVAALAGPLWIEEEGRREPGRVVVLVDSSRSMGTLEGGEPRHEAVDALLDQLSDSQVEVMHFGAELAAGPPTAYDDGGTDLQAALAALSERVAGERLAAVVVISDGLDRGALRRRFLAEEAPLPPDAPGPISVYQVGAAEDLVDLSVRSVDAGGYAFLRSPFRIEAGLVGVGYAGKTVQVTLSRDGAPITSRTVTLDDQGVADVGFEVTPGEAGRFTYTVSVPVFEGDAVPSNNQMAVVVKVVRDRIRVLQVCGAPSWDVKMLRRFLKGDPSVDLVSFFILRTNRDMDAGYDDDELSLIQFPHEQLFTDDLWSFDLVIFQNFDYEPYFGAIGRRGASRLLGNIAEFVKDQGHGFVMIGGSKSFDLGAYAESPIADILPVELGLKDDLVIADPFRPALTEAGRRHPITRLVEDDVENSLWWDRLHAQDGANRVVAARPGSAVLLTHPTERTAGGAPMPVLAVREAGAGRAMALTVDASWRWSFSEAAEGRGNQAYLRFWKNAMRWLVKDPTTGRVIVDTPRENYAVGDTVRVVVRARDQSFEPLPQANVVVEVATEAGTEEFLARTGPDGEAVLDVPAERRGAHRVTAVVKRGETPVGSAETVYAVTTRDPELDEVVPDGTFLRWLAESTGGRYYAPGDRGSPVIDGEAGRTVWDRREVALGRVPLVALWVALFAGIAWIVRRRAGLR